MSDIGFKSVRPSIDRISFRKPGYMILGLLDKRMIYVPLTHFPGIARLSPGERRQYHIADGEIVLFPNDDEVYHIQDFLGTYESNVYESPSQQLIRRLRTGGTFEIGGKKFTAKSPEKKENARVKTTPV